MGVHSTPSSRVNPRSRTASSETCLVLGLEWEDSAAGAPQQDSQLSWMLSQSSPGVCPRGESAPQIWATFSNLVSETRQCHSCALCHQSNCKGPPTFMRMQNQLDLLMEEYKSSGKTCRAKTVGAAIFYKTQICCSVVHVSSANRQGRR